MAATLTVHDNIIKDIRYYAVLSRIFFITLQVVANLVIPDHGADAFRSPFNQIEGPQSIPDHIIEILFGGFARWDSQYFLHISVYGYTHENCLAFFPLFPLLCTSAGKLVKLVFLGYIEYAYLVTLRLSGNVNFSFLTSLFLCVSPATIFFIAQYTETLFMFLTLLIIYNCLENRHITAACFAGLSATVRSNGLVNTGFVLYYTITSLLQTRQQRYLFELLAGLAISVLPFLGVQYFAYQEFCLTRGVTLPPELVELLNGLVVKGSGKSEWCESSVPFSYSYIQAKYWQVGFLGYYTLKQIPNFILAFPVFVLCSVYFKKYLENFRLQEEFIKYFPFAVHVAFLLVFCAFFVHIQVTTRLISSASLVVYWSAASLFPRTKLDLSLGSRKMLQILLDERGNWNLQQKWTVYYFLGYSILGTVLFCNYLPWT